MDVAYLKDIGLLSTSIDAHHILSDAKNEDTGIQDAICKVYEAPKSKLPSLTLAFSGPNSKWTPEALALELQRLPVASLFPRLTEEIVEVLKRWHQRFPIKIWKRIVRVYEGAAHQTPCVLKEFNESAPVICQVREWISALPSNSIAAHVIDLGAGYGFLSMFLSELLPSRRVSKCILMDSTYANKGVESSSGSTSTHHIYDFGSWRIPLHTLKVDLKKGRALSQVSERILRAPSGEGALQPAPAIVCGVHLCNTLGLRAAQLFNENPEVVGFAFVPCCFPTSRHLLQEVVYQVGQHRFAAKDFLDHKVFPSNAVRFEKWSEHILEGIEPGPLGSKRIELHSLSRPRKGMYPQDTYMFAERPAMQDLDSRPGIESLGQAVVVDAKYGHANAREHRVRKNGKRKD